MLNSFYDSINEYKIFLGNNENFTLPQMQIPSYSLYNFNNISMMNTNDKANLEDCVNINNIASYLNNKSELKKINITFISSKNNEESGEPELYTSNKILNIFNKEQNKDLFKENLKQLEFSEYIEYDLELTKKKRIRPFDFDELISNKNIKNDEEKIKEKIKRGRKPTKQKRETHDKRSPDNIIRKVKVFIFKFILLFLNNIINENCKYKKIKLLKLDYKFINRIKADQELKILNMSLKELFSNDISPKFKNKCPKDYNKEIIARILKDADDIILFSFDMTLRDWLDIFTLKKSVKDIVNGYNKYKDCQNLIQKVEKSLIRFDKAIYKIDENNDKDYMALFVFCLYNYERWFYLKKCRKRD
jgi:hypothetical protein